jgi:hypothetical protein
MALTEKLTSIANAIRGKTGGTDPLTLDAMAEAIAGIEAGSGGGGGELDALFDKTITELSTNATTIPKYAFENCIQLTTANCPSVTSIGQNAFYGCSGLITANIPNVTSIGNSAFQKCEKLVAVDFPQVTSIGTNQFNSCFALKTAHLPRITALTQRDFQNCWKLQKADFTSLTSIGAYVFYDCRSLTALIIRSDTLCAMTATTVINNWYHFTGTTKPENPDGLKDGYVYVPRALVSSYQSATNWSVLEADRFRALEDYTVDGTITGELDPGKI